VLVLVIVYNVVFVLAYDVHSAKYVKSVVHSSLHVFKVDFLSNLSIYYAKRLTSQNSLYISSISFAICVPVTMGRSLTFWRTDFERKTSFLSFFSSSSSNSKESSLLILTTKLTY